MKDFHWCRRSGSNRHGGCPPTVFETAASAYSATSAALSGWSGRRDSNSRSSPWQGDALPLSHFRIFKPGYLNSLLFWRHPRANKPSVNVQLYGAEAQNRTGDTRIFSPLLYRLSYLGTRIIVSTGSRECQVKPSLPSFLLTLYVTYFDACIETWGID